MQHTFLMISYCFNRTQNYKVNDIFEYNLATRIHITVEYTKYKCSVITIKLDIPIIWENQAVAIYSNNTF